MPVPKAAPKQTGSGPALRHVQIAVPEASGGPEIHFPSEGPKKDKI